MSLRRRYALRSYTRNGLRPPLFALPCSPVARARETRLLSLNSPVPKARETRLLSLGSPPARAN